MQNFVMEMINEHAETVNRIAKLQNVIPQIKEKVNADEYANMNVQLSLEKQLANVLEVRLSNQGIIINEQGEYFEKVAQLTKDGIIHKIKININNAKENEKTSSDNN